MQEITAYLCPRPWKPSGLCSPSFFDTSIKSSSKDDTIEMEAYLCPEGFDCDHMEITAYLLNEDKNAIDCLLCIPACDESAIEVLPEVAYSDFCLALLDLHNEARKTHPNECTSPCNNLELDKDLCEIANWHAKDMILNDYFSHVDSLGRTHAERLNSFGYYRLRTGENIAYQIYKESKGYSNVAMDFMNAWMNSPGHRKNLMLSIWNRVGFGLGYRIWTDGINIYRKYICVAIFAQDDIGKYNSAILTKPSLPCTSECVQQILWYQDFITKKDEENIEYKIPKPIIITKIKIPRICGLYKVRFEFELSPCYAECYLDKFKKEIPEDNHLEYAWNNQDFTFSIIKDNEWIISWNFSDKQHCFYPGSYMVVWGWLKDYTECNPFVIALGWFETYCWTSAIVQGCGLLEPDGTLVAGGLGTSMQDEWIGDSRLHWLVHFKGSYYWLQSSDFTRYNIGDRVTIYKSGTSKAINQQGMLVFEPGCRGPIPWYSEYPIVYQKDSELNFETVSSDNVAYTLDPSNDIIVPVRFW